MPLGWRKPARRARRASLPSRRPQRRCDRIEDSAARAVALAATGVGVVFVAIGVLMGQPLASVLGAIVLLAGVVALAMTIARKPAAAPAEVSLSADAARLRADAVAQRSLATTAGSRAWMPVTGEWRAWLAERGLDAHGDDPAAVRALLEELAERRPAAR